MHSKKQTSMALDCTPDLPNHPPASHLLFGLRSAPPTRSCFLPSPAGHDSHVSGPRLSTIHKPNTPPRCAHLIRPSPLVLPQLLTPTASAASSCLPSPSRPTVAVNLRPSPAVSFLALPVSPSPPRKRNEAIPKLVLPAVSAVRASIARSHRRTLSVQLAPRSPHTPSYCEKMLRLSLARDEHAQTGRSKPSVFDASFSPDGSVSSSSSQKSSQASGSRSPSPAGREPSRRMSPSPTRIRVPRSNTVSHTRSTSQGVPTTSSHLPRSRTHPSDLSAVVPQSLFRRPSRNRNEEVLRSRLEGVLSSASSNRDISCPPSPTRKRAATSGDSFGLITPPHTLGYSTLPIHPSMTRSKTSPAVSRSSRAGTMTPSPITPPPSPPFDANRIALQLRDREGYVSFADVQGLGIPQDDGDVDDCDPERGRGRWWSLWKG